MTAEHHLDVTPRCLATNGLSHTVLLGEGGGFDQLCLPKLVPVFFLTMLPIVTAVSVKERGAGFFTCAVQ